MQTSEVLNLAADLIEKRGWTQGGPTSPTTDPWGDNGGPVCLEGGIIAALGSRRVDLVGKFYTCPAHNAVADYLGRNPQPTQGPYRDSLWQWNDTEGRTAAEVIEVLRAAAVIEAARESKAVEVSA